jgi:hypothetical protein
MMPAEICLKTTPLMPPPDAGKSRLLYADDAAVTWDYRRGNNRRSDSRYCMVCPDSGNLPELRSTLCAVPVFPATLKVGDPALLSQSLADHMLQYGLHLVQCLFLADLRFAHHLYRKVHEHLDRLSPLASRKRGRTMQPLPLAMAL